MKRPIFACIRALLLTVACTAAYGLETQTVKPLTIISSYAAGGLSDRLARLTAQYLSVELKTPVVVKNLTGAGGVLAAREVFNLPAQSSAMLLTDSSLLLADAIDDDNVPHTGAFLPIGSLGNTPFALCVANQSPIQNLNDLVRTLQSPKASSSFGSPGVRTIHRLLADRFLRKIGASAVHIPYQGGSGMLADLFQERLTFGIMTVSLAIEHAQGGRLRILAVTGTKRSQFLPQIPALTESFPGMTANTTAYLLASPHTPSALHKSLTQAWDRIWKNPAFVQDILRLEFSPKLLGHGHTRTLMNQEAASFRNLLQMMNAQSNKTDP